MGLSVPELAVKLLNDQPDLLAVAPGGAAFGAGEEEQQAKGMILVRERGFSRNEVDLPLQHARINVVALASTIDQADLIKSKIEEIFDSRKKDPNILNNRLIVHQDSSGEDFLVHGVRVIGGPNSHVSPTLKTFYESELTMELLVGTQPIVQVGVT